MSIAPPSSGFFIANQGKNVMGRAFHHNAFERCHFDVEFFDAASSDDETWTAKTKQAETWTPKSQDAETWTGPCEEA